VSRANNAAMPQKVGAPRISQARQRGRNQQGSVMFLRTLRRRPTRAARYALWQQRKSAG
jgi:hypothetical protein